MSMMMMMMMDRQMDTVLIYNPCSTYYVNSAKSHTVTVIIS